MNSICPQIAEFTISGKEKRNSRAKAAEVDCESVGGSGEFENTQSGDRSNCGFEGCELLATPCYVIETTILPVHVATVIDPPNSRPGTLVTPNGAHFLTITCFFGLVEIEVGGNGAAGEITSPGVGESSNSRTFDFETEGGSQTITEARMGGGELKTFELEVSVNGNEPEPAGLDIVGSNSFVEGGRGTLTE